MRGIIFDKDGVLFDSELGKMDAMKKALLSLSINYSELRGFDEWYFERVGIPGIQSCRMFIEKYNFCNLDPIKLYNRLETIRELMIKTNPSSVLENNLNFLKSIPRERFRVGLSSSDFRTNIIIQLKEAGILKYFDAITSGEKSAGEVKRDKPSPDIYLLTARKLGISSERCIGIEDTDTGIKSVKSAGMFCIAYRNPNSGNQKLSEADLIVDDLMKVKLDHLF